MPQKKIEWKTEQRVVNDLIPLEINPRKISEEKRASLIKSIEKFNLAEIPAINKDNQIIAGHQRLKALQMIGRGEEIIDVRVPNRQLTEKELKEYNLVSNTHAGEWDWEILDANFSEFDLNDLGIELPESEEEITEADNTYDPFDDAGIKAKNQFAVIVIAEDEINQQEIFENLSSMGYKLKIAVA